MVGLQARLVALHGDAVLVPLARPLEDPLSPAAPQWRASGPAPSSPPETLHRQAPEAWLRRPSQRSERAEDLWEQAPRERMRNQQRAVPVDLTGSDPAIPCEDHRMTGVTSATSHHRLQWPIHCCPGRGERLVLADR